MSLKYTDEPLPTLARDVSKNRKNVRRAVSEMYFRVPKSASHKSLKNVCAFRLFSCVLPPRHECRCNQDGAIAISDFARITRKSHCITDCPSRFSDLPPALLC